MTNRPPQAVFEALASAIGARANCAAQTPRNTEWFDRWSDRIGQIERDMLPSGAGIDNGTRVDLDRSTSEKLVLHTAYHHMDEFGSYSGWSEHTVTVTGALIGRIDIAISGRDRNQIKDYLHDVYHTALMADAAPLVAE